MTRIARSLVVACFAAALVGCSTNNITKVTGKVTMDGEPIDGVVLNFQCPPDNLNQGSFSAVSKEDGTFEYVHDIKGPRVMPGKFTVIFMDGKLQRNMEDMHLLVKDPRKMQELLKSSRVDKKYNDPANGTAVDVGTGVTDVGELKLTSK